MQKFLCTFPAYQSESGWNALLPKREPKHIAPEQAEFDAIVIGAGVTGLAAAKRIAELEPNSQVLLIDASTVGEGASGRNSGFGVWGATEQKVHSRINAVEWMVSDVDSNFRLSCRAF